MAVQANLLMYHSTVDQSRAQTCSWRLTAADEAPELKAELRLLDVNAAVRMLHFGTATSLLATAGRWAATAG